MTPEKGDKAIHVGRHDVADAFRRVGAIPGDTVMFHGSLSSMGTVDGGVTTVFDGILDATAPNGTVAMPSLWYDGSDELRHPERFDIKNSPTWVGALAEGLRTDPRSIRSNHWTHSVSAIGARAAELCANHGAYGERPSPWSETAFAVSSPWQRLIDWNALYCLIGVDLRVCTIKHLIEGMLVEHALDHVPASRRQEFRNLQTRDAQPRIPGWPAFDCGQMMQLLEYKNVITKTKLGSATLRAFRTAPFVSTVLEVIENDLTAWLSPEFLEWRQKCIDANKN
ncbi:MAG: AAC(3) family N-acetyltransferase [Victivallales bacterium]|nr:AAC(3) family N-acetyltransferase [Victivallales bacterium]